MDYSVLCDGEFSNMDSKSFLLMQMGTSFLTFN